MNNKYDLKEVPNGVINYKFKEDEQEPEGVKWSGNGDVPEIGAQVQITFNSLGTGTVDGYFIEDWWLGVKVILDNQPEWHRKQNPGRNFALAFGTEIKMSDSVT